MQLHPALIFVDIQGGAHTARSRSEREQGETGSCRPALPDTRMTTFSDPSRSRTSTRILLTKQAPLKRGLQDRLSIAKLICYPTKTFLRRPNHHSISLIQIEAFVCEYEYIRTVYGLLESGSTRFRSDSQPGIQSGWLPPVTTTPQASARIAS